MCVMCAQAAGGQPSDRAAGGAAAAAATRRPVSAATPPRVTLTLMSTARVARRTRYAATTAGRSVHVRF